jgi:cation diffusion facilitator family transporter
MQRLRVLQISLVAVASVILVEGAIGFAANSLAILSDAMHASFDAVAMAILVLTTRIALKPPDEEHMYGHAKIESIGGMMGGVSLVALAIVLFYEAFLRLTVGVVRPNNPEGIGFIAIFYTLCIDVFRITITRRVMSDENQQSPTVKASFYDALGDFGSTTVTLLGFGLAVLAGIVRADAFASIVLSLFLIYLSTSLLRSSFLDLSDSVPRRLAERIKQQVVRVEGVESCKELKVRRLGGRNYIELTVTASGKMSLKEAHDLTVKIERNITRVFGKGSVTIHVEPEKGRSTSLGSLITDDL